MTRLIEVSKKFNSMPKKQDIHMCIIRTDYMLDQKVK